MQNYKIGVMKMLKKEKVTIEFCIQTLFNLFYKKKIIVFLLIFVWKRTQNLFPVFYRQQATTANRLQCVTVRWTIIIKHTVMGNIQYRMQYFPCCG
jgi:hypothetical protein